jgi:NitT/TauT family transport system permease protein
VTASGGVVGSGGVAGPARRRRRRGVSLEKYLLPLAAFTVLLTAWELAVSSKAIPELFFSSPSAILASAGRNLGTASFWNDVAVSVQEFAIGYGIAVVLAIPFGMLTAWFRTPHYLFEPWLAGFNATPRLALLPLVVLWVGLGFWSKAVIVFLGAFFPIAINTFHGVRTVDKNHLDVSTSFGASPARRVWTVVLPSTLPFTLVGMRLGVGRGVTGVIVGEFYTSQAGLGHFIFEAGGKMQSDDLLFGAIFVMLLALVVFRVVGIAERRFKAWQPQVGSS